MSLLRNTLFRDIVFYAAVTAVMSKSDIVLRADTDYTLSDFQLLPNSLNQVKFSPQLLQNVSYQVQFHTANFNISLSLQQGLATYRDLGSDLGIILSSMDVSGFYLSNPHGSSITVRANAKLLSQLVPIPGGCNEEFNFPKDPQIVVAVRDYTYRLTFQYSSVAAWDTCVNKDLWDRLVYRVHIHYDSTQTGDEALYAAMSQLLDPGMVPEHSFYTILIGTRSSLGRPTLDITRYRSDNAVFTITVTDSMTGTVSAYVPTIVRPSASVVGWYWYFLATLFALSSLPLCYFSHTWFSATQLYSGSVAFALAAVMSLGALHVAPLGVAFGSLGLSLLGGIFWLLVWKFCGKPTLSIVLISMVGGYLLTSICFFSPLVSVEVFLDYPWEVWMITAIVILFALAASLIFRKKLHIISSVFISSYLSTMALSIYCDSIFHFIVVERFRRATFAEYNQAIFSTSIQPKDGGVCAVWVFLLISGMIVQFYRTRNDPDLPAAPDRRCKRRPRNPSGQATGGNTRHLAGSSPEETQNLLNQGQESENLSQHIPHYGAVES